VDDDDQNDESAVDENDQNDEFIGNEPYPIIDNDEEQHGISAETHDEVNDHDNDVLIEDTKPHEPEDPTTGRNRRNHGPYVWDKIWTIQPTSA
jgi:hypothetical protein